MIPAGEAGRIVTPTSMVSGAGVTAPPASERSVSGRVARAANPLATEV